MSGHTYTHTYTRDNYSNARCGKRNPTSYITHDARYIGDFLSDVHFSDLVKMRES